MPIIVLTANDIVNRDTGNNRLVYQFQGGGVSFNNNEIALCSLQMYYSWFNINEQLYKNSKYQYVWVDGTIHDVVMPNGFYSVSDLNNFLEATMIQNTHYLVDTTTGNFVYYLQWETNATYYAVQMNAYLVPNTLPVGFSLPPSATWSLPATSQTPRITILNNGFQDIVGFYAGTYPPTSPYTTTYSKISDVAPQLNPISSIQITCSLASNPYSPQSKQIYAFGVPEVVFGGNILINTPEYAFQQIINGSYNQFVVEIIDQNGRPINLQDPQICIVLVIRDRGTNQ